MPCHVETGLRRRMGWKSLFLCLGTVALLISSADRVWAQDEDEGEVLLQMVAELVGDEDRDMRALGMEQVREAAPGEEATKRFVGLLSDLEPEAKAELVEALGERADAAARPAILELVDSDQPAVRSAALRALAGLGVVDDVPLLAEKAAAGPAEEQQAAQRSLVRLRAEKTDDAIVATLADARAEVRAELLKALAARNAKQALPAVFECAAEPDPVVRLAALDALRYLADEGQVSELVTIVQTAEDEAQRRKAALALLVVCSRGREKCVESIAAALNDADEANGIVLLRALARCGGPTALEVIAAQMQDDSEAIRDEAVRMLSFWPNAAVAHYLKALSENDENSRHQILAIRGLVRLASPQKEKLADVKMLADAMKSATRPAEMILALGVLGNLASAEALAAALPAIENASVVEEAGLAVTMIAEKMEDGDQDRIQAAMQKVLDQVQKPETRRRAQEVLDSL